MIRRTLHTFVMMLLPLFVFSQTDLIISEYVEGSSNNKYIEIYNGTAIDIDLSDYELRLFANGAATPTTTNTLSGTIVSGGVVVYKNSSATVYGGSATSMSAVNFNGDDAIALYKISTSSYIDIFGCIGCDPGSAWTTTNTTLNKTLVRNASVCDGITANPPSCTFPTLDSEWTQYNQDDVSNLGSHTGCISGGCSAPSTQASSVTTVMTDTSAIEISWADGDGENCVVFINSTGTFVDPTDGTDPSADYSWNDAGQQCVYNGNGNDVLIVGLDPNTTYYFAVYEYNCNGANQTYNTDEATHSESTISVFDYVQIESIMVDACHPDGGMEGQNEMFRFRVDSVDMHTEDLIITWPNNSWLGLETGTNTAGITTSDIVDSINALVTVGDGMLIEPTGGVIPAGSQVLFFTSSDFMFNLFDWSGLSDTLYALFQEEGNTAGHFVNSAADGVYRTLIVEFEYYDSDTVSYEPYHLYGGDGAGVDFDDPGNPTYGNCGCKAPYEDISLPVVLKYQLLTCDRLEWATYVEINCDRYEIQYSNDTRSWYVEKVIQGQGFKNELTVYEYADINNGYYRIVQYDLDGKLTVFPVLYIDCDNNGERRDIVVYDMLGRRQETTKQMSSGVYIIIDGDNVKKVFILGEQ